MSRFRDKGIDFVEALIEGKWRSPQLQMLQERIAKLPADELGLLRAVTEEALDTALHDFLFALEEAEDFQSGIELRVDGINAVTLSDGLQGELFGDDGWCAQFSKHGERAQ